jgi:hypothetical protein
MPPPIGHFDVAGINSRRRNELAVPSVVVVWLTGDEAR